MSLSLLLLPSQRMWQPHLISTRPRRPRGGVPAALLGRGRGRTHSRTHQKINLIFLSGSSVLLFASSVSQTLASVASWVCVLLTEVCLSFWGSMDSNPCPQRLSVSPSHLPLPPSATHMTCKQSALLSRARNIKTDITHRYVFRPPASTTPPPSPSSTSSCPSREAKNTTVGNRSDKNKSKNRERELHSAIFGAKGFEKTVFELFLRVPLARGRGRGTISRPPSSVFVPLLFSPDFGAGDSE